MKRSIRLSRTMLVTALLSGSSACLAQAVAADAEMPSDASAEIIVTAQKRSQSLQDVPVSIDVVSSEMLASRQVQQLSGLAAIVPGFEYVRAPNNIPGLTFRGIGPQSGNLAFDSSIAMAVDGVFMGNLRMYSQTLFDVDRVELIKGTQSTLLGKNTTIGALSIINKRPGSIFAGRVEAGGEIQNGGYFADAAVDLPASDVLKFRIAGRYFHANGSIKNVTTGLQGPVRTDLGVRAQALYDPGNGFDLLLSYQHTDNKIVGSSNQCVAPGFTFPGLPGAPYAPGTNISAVCGDGVENDIRASFSSDPRLADGDDLNQTKVDMAIATFNLDLGGAIFTSISAGVWEETAAYLDFDFDNKDATVVLTDDRQRQFSQEFRIASDDSQAKFQYLVGLYYYTAKYHTVNEADWGIPDFPPPFLGLPFPPGQLFNGAYRTTFDQKTDTYSAFGQVTLKPSQPLTINLGARYTREKRDVSMGRAIVGPVVTLWNTVIQAPFPYQRLTPVTDNLISGSVSIQYEFDSSMMIYASASRGGKAGGYGELNSVPFDGRTFYNGMPGGNPNVDAAVGNERANAFEAGIKSRLLDRRLTLNLAAFWTDIFGLQQLVFTPSGTFASSNDRVRSRGVEGTFSFRPTPQLSLGLSATYSDVRDLRNDQRIAQSPRLSGTASIDWTTNLSNDLQLTLGASGRHRSSKFNQLGEAEPDDAFNTVGLRARLESEAGWFINASGENIFNAKGADFGFPGPDPYIKSFKTLSPLRTITLSIGTQF